ncbi:hypothetical protein BH11VER1_BH11VER1_32220 [soil metagenome]
MLLYRHLLITSVASLILLTGFSMIAAAEAPRGKDAYDKQVKPVLTQYCYDCHGDGMDKGHLALDKYSDFTSMLKDRKLWESVREHVTTHVMPPENKPQPTLAERDAIVQWIDDQVFWFDPTKSDPGHITLRRLNRVEYDNTVRDVFRIKSRPSEAFPPDDTGYGYDNIGDVLSLSPLLMEKYLRASRKVAEEAVWIKEPERKEVEKGASDFVVTEGQGGIMDGFSTLFTNGEMTAKITMAEDGIYRMQSYVTATQSGPEKAKYAFTLDGQVVKDGEITEAYDHDKPNDGWQTISADFVLKKGEHKVGLRFLNDFGDPQAKDPKKRDRNLLFMSMTVEGPIKFRAPEQSEFLKWVLDGKSLNEPQLMIKGTDFNDGEGANYFYENSAFLAANGFVHRDVEVNTAGDFQINLVASADPAGSEGAKFSAKLGEVDLGTFEITGKKGVQQTFRVKAPLKAGKQELKITFLNDLWESGKDRNMAIHNIMLEGPINPTSLTLSREKVQEWIARIGMKTLRRPLDTEEQGKLFALAEMAAKEGASIQENLSVISEALLCSPKFLFRGGADAVGQPENGIALVDEFTLASRLSYFLWSSCPDDELLTLAAKGELRKNLPQQFQRMVKDWKSYALSENFAGQWLQLRDMDVVAPNNYMFPEFSKNGIASSMKRESEQFFDFIYRQNHSVLEFLDSDYTFLDEKLANFYGIKGVKGKEFRKVSLAGTPRGGILTQGSILTLTSHPNRTSPVKRGKFLLENILGTPPPPPPQNVPAFKEDKASRSQGTLRQQFEAHRSNPSCASCHAFLDPMGFAMEHYDAVGRWRDTDNKAPIDSTGKLLTGQAFDGVEQLRKLLANERKNEFTKCLVENLLIFSLGRGLEYSDKPFVKQMVQNAEKNGYKFQDIVFSVIESTPFQKMQANQAKKVAEK